MENFYYDIPTKVFFGKGSVKHLPECIKKFGTHVLLVYGGGSIKRSGLYDHVMELLKENGISCTELAGVEPNPRLSTVKRGVKLCRESGASVILPIGGGSTIDCAKAISAAVYYDGDPWDLVEDAGKIGRTLPVVAISTMSATGSEMDYFSVITNEETKEKRDIADLSIYPAYAILDPEYTFSLPAYQTAAGVADIMSHVFELYFANGKETFIQDRLMEALLLTLVHYGPIAYKEPDNYDARANIMWASEWAINGLISCGKSSPWPAHAIEHQLSAYYDITHGHGLAIVTPVLMEYILNEKSLPQFVNYGINVWKIDASLPKMEIAKAAIAKTRELFVSMGLSMHLRELGITDDKYFGEMATKAMADGLEECLVPLAKEDVVEIYNRCL